MKATLEKMTDSYLLAIWNDKNNHGLGWGPGQNDQSPADAAIDEGYEIIRHLGEIGTPEYGAIVAAKNDEYIIVADCHGPWAQDITDTDILED